MIQIRAILTYVVLSGLLVFIPIKNWGKSLSDGSRNLLSPLGIPTEESGDYCLFKFDDEIIELYFIEVENEYGIIVVYTIL